MSELFIGLMSGTSIDAVDAALVDFSASPLKLIATHKECFPFSLQQDLHDICLSGSDEINRMGQLDEQVGEIFAQACNHLLEKAQLSSEKIRGIGSHGQTIRHQPSLTYPFTLQIGNPHRIAEMTGITTIADFRKRDMVAGGQGAPLVPAFHHAMFYNNKKNRCIVNIGGIANITFLFSNQAFPIIGFDTGPGNTLLDAWTKKYLKENYDKNGSWSLTGKTNKNLLEALLNDPFFQKTPPKSTGREYFNLVWLEKKIFASILPEDVQRTLVELTAITIMQAVNEIDTHCEIFICGGGVHNQTLIQSLKNLEGAHTIYSTKEIGIDPDWVEAIAFAWLAKQTLNGKTGNLPSVTGAKKSVVLGSIYP